MSFSQQSQSITNNTMSPNIETDLPNLTDLRKQNNNKPVIGYLNINSLRNMIDYLRDICKKSCIDKTTIHSSFPDAQFHIDGYQFPPLRKDHNHNGEEKIVYIKEGIIRKRIIPVDTPTSLQRRYDLANRRYSDVAI